MPEDLPEEFDLVVVGTGFTESCVAAAASRLGKTVFQIDSNGFYGGAWASFNLESFCQHMDNYLGKEIRHMSYKWSVSDDITLEQSLWSKSNILEHSRRFNIDLCPKILYAVGELVQLLITSNICRYAEFRAVDQIYTLFEKKLLKVPCTRSDVFNTKDLNIVEKRLLMKLLTSCMAYDDSKANEEIAMYQDKTFYEYLLQQKVTEKIVTCIMQAIAMCNRNTPFKIGMQRIKLFLNSLGRYGNTPFLFPMYGCGEIPQCFCRLCAVFGGIYCLKRDISDVNFNEDTNSITIALKENQENCDLQRDTIKAKHVVFSHSNLPFIAQNKSLNVLDHGRIENHLSRAVLITSGPIFNEEPGTGGGGVNLLRLFADEREAVVIQLSHYSGTCPKDVYLLHLTTMAISDQPEEDLQPFITQLFAEVDAPTPVIFSAFFTLTARTQDNDNPTTKMLPIICTDGPYFELDYDNSIQNAREIFRKLYDDAEFLPRAPDPEEILIDGEDPLTLSDVNLPADLCEQMRELEETAAVMNINKEIQ